MMLKNRNLLFVILSLCYGESNSYTNATIDNAIEKYSELANDNPNNKEIDYNLGNLNYYKGELDRAISHYNEALKTENNNLKSNTHFNLGNTYYNLEDYEKSLNEYKKSLIMNPDNKDARYNYEFVKKIINQQKQKKQENQQQQDGEKQEQEDGDGQQQQDGEQQEQEDGDGQQQQDGEQQEHGDGGQKQNEGEITAEKMLEKQEAEAILNSLKANEKNLMKRKYKTLKPIKVLKDW